MALRRLVPALVLAACAIGCAGSRPGLLAPFGWEEARLDSTSYVVSFQGGAGTSRDSVRRAVLKRCAELTREAGRDYFVLSSIRTTGYRDDVLLPDQATSGSGSATPAQRTTGIDTPTGMPMKTAAQIPGEWIQVSRYRTTVTMRLYSGPRPADDPNAHEVEEYLGAPRGD
jgi:hypothetical protein